MGTLRPTDARRFYVLAAVLALQCSGCCILRGGPGPLPPPAPRATILETLRQRADQFTSVSDIGITLIIEVETEKGMRAQPKLGGILAFNRRLPGLRLHAEKMTSEVFDLRALGERFSLELPHSHELVTGSRRAYYRLPFLIHPYEATAWFGQPQWLGLDADATMEIEADDYRFDVLMEGLVIRSVFVDRRKVAISRIVDYDLLGSVRTEVLMDGYKKVDGGDFPYRLTVNRPQDGCRVQLRLGKPRFNNPKLEDESAFKPRKLPPGWKEIDLDSEPLSNISAFSGEQ